MAPRASAALAALALALAPAAASAREGIYGGTTAAGDPIVIDSDAHGRQITGAAFRVRVDGDDDWWPVAGSARVRPAPSRPTTIPLGVLIASRNAGGRFDTRLFARMGHDPAQEIMVGIALAGSLTPSRASGTIAGWVSVTDTATGRLSGYSRTKAIRWTAVRAPGRVYGGTTAAGLPIVIKLGPNAVTGLWLACYSDRSTPAGMFWSSSERLGGFPLAGGRFGGAFSRPETEANGSTTTYDWTLAGRVTPTTATGTIALNVKVAEASRAPLSFAMPATRFAAATG